MTQEQKPEPSGITTRGILNEIRDRRREAIATMFKSIGAKPKHVEAIVDGFNTGFNQCINDLIAMNVIAIVPDPTQADAAASTDDT